MKFDVAKVLVGLALFLALHAQGQVDADAVRASTYQVVVESNKLLQQGDYDGAAALLEALDLSDSSPAELFLVRETLANTYQMNQNYERAIANYRLILDDPANLTLEDMSRLSYRLATASYQIGDYEGVLEVVEAWKESVENLPPDAYKILALAQSKLGNRAAALAAGERYVAALRVAGDPVPESFLRFLEIAQRPTGETSDLYTTELEDLASPEIVDVLEQANDLIGRQRFVDATALLSEAIETHGGTVTETALLREKLAWALGHRRDMAGAKEQFRKITAAPGELPSPMLDQVWMRLASASYRAGDYEEALESTEVWKNRIGNPPVIYFRMMAMTHWQLDNGEYAMSYGKRYVEEARRAGEEISPSFKALFRDVLDELVGGN